MNLNLSTIRTYFESKRVPLVQATKSTDIFGQSNPNSSSICVNQYEPTYFDKKLSNLATSASGALMAHTRMSLRMMLFDSITPASLRELTMFAGQTLSVSALYFIYVNACMDLFGGLGHLHKESTGAVSFYNEGKTFCITLDLKVTHDLQFQDLLAHGRIVSTAQDPENDMTAVFASVVEKYSEVFKQTEAGAGVGICRDILSKVLYHSASAIHPGQCVNAIQAFEHTPADMHQEILVLVQRMQDSGQVVGQDSGGYDLFAPKACVYFEPTEVIGIWRRTTTQATPSSLGRHLQGF